MADITQDPMVVSPDGHSIPLSDFKGSGRLEPGRIVTLGTKAADTGNWEVLRIDDEAGIVHLVRADRAEKLKVDHAKTGHRPDGSLGVA